MPDDACARATAVAMETIIRECTDRDGQMEEINDDVFVFVPDDVADQQFGYSLNSPETQAEREEAVEACVDSEWAREWADSFVGDDAPREAHESARREACEGLFGGARA